MYVITFEFVDFRISVMTVLHEAFESRLPCSQLFIAYLSLTDFGGRQAVSPKGQGNAGHHTSAAPPRPVGVWWPWQRL